MASEEPPKKPSPVTPVDGVKGTPELESALME
jgi:hypothetical protein